MDKWADRIDWNMVLPMVLAPTLYNIYTSNCPATSATRCMHADVALTVYATHVKEVEDKLSSAMGIIYQYLGNFPPEKSLWHPTTFRCKWT